MPLLLIQNRFCFILTVQNCQILFQLATCILLSNSTFHSQYVFFPCNRLGHIAENCRGKTRCTKCGGEHNVNLCNATFLKCVNCGGSHSAANKDRSRYKREKQVLQIRATHKLPYAEACKQLTTCLTCFSSTGNTIMNKFKIVIIHRFQTQVRLAPLIQDLLRPEKAHSDPSSKQVEIFQIILYLEIQFILLPF